MQAFVKSAGVSMADQGGDRMNVTRKKRFAAILLGAIFLFSAALLLPGIRSVFLLLAAAGLAGLFAFALLFRTHGTERKTAFVFILLAALIFCFAAWYGLWFRTAKIDACTALADGKEHTAQGYVSDVLYEKPYGSAYYIKLLSVDGEPAGGCASLSLPFAGELLPYDEISFTGIFIENEAEYDSYLKSRGIVICAQAEDFEITGTHKRDLSYLTDRIVGWIAERFERDIGGKEAGFATALLTGNRENLDGQTRLAYNRLGISHILAVSGLHLSVIVGGADFLLRKLTFPRRKKDILLIMLTFFFALVCGFTASVMRAAVMLGIYYLADLLGERSDTFTSLCLAVALILFIRPFSVYDAGLWLSFLSTLGIVTVSPFLDGLFPKRREKRGIRTVCFRVLHSLAGLLVMTFTATFFTMPVTYLLYGGISLVSPLANLIFVPLTEFILYLLVLMTVFFFVPFLTAALGDICRTWIVFADEIAGFLSDLEGIYFSIRYPFAVYIIVALVVGTTAVLFIRRLNPGWILAVFLICTVAFGTSYAVFEGMTDGDVKVFVQSDGKSDMVGFVSDGKAILIDIGNGGYTLPSEATDSLAGYYECEIDLFVLTHLHSYHAGTLKKLADKIKIHHILLPEAESERDAEVISSILSAMDGICDVSFYPRDGCSFVECGSLRIFLPDYRTLSRSEHPAITFSAEIAGYDRMAFVYAGSSSYEFDEVSALSKGACVIMCGAHGPVTKNIFDSACLADSDYVIFADEGLAFFVKTEDIQGEMLFFEEGEKKIGFSYEE